MKIKRFIFCLGKLDLKHAFKMGSYKVGLVVEGRRGGLIFN